MERCQDLGVGSRATELDRRSVSPFRRLARSNQSARLAARDTPVQHFPYIQALQLEWERTPTGFKPHRQDPNRFEVICARCGDSDGPIYNQPAACQRLRGPYDSRRSAMRAARNHQREAWRAVKRSRWVWLRDSSTDLISKRQLKVEQLLEARREVQLARIRRRRSD
jgi:hypothetical protein